MSEGNEVSAVFQPHVLYLSITSSHTTAFSLGWWPFHFPNFSTFLQPSPVVLLAQVESSDGGEYDDGFGEVSFQVIDEAFIAAAEAAQIVWGKVGSYPHWPVRLSFIFFFTFHPIFYF